jgi:parvulin-like peptidyl-prolyl isomerase
MKARFFLPLILLGMLAAAGCGGGGGSSANVQPGDVAVVGGTHIPKAQFDELMSEAKANYKLQGRTFPKAGSTEYSSIKSQAITILVQQAETEAEAAKLGITVTNQDIAKQLKDIKQRCCQGSETKYKAALKQQGLTDQEVRDNARTNAYGQKLAAQLTKGITVAPTAIEAYYIQHQTDFQTPASRPVRYILVGKKKGAAALASSLYGQLKSAPKSTWCTLAKKYSQDPSSSGKCGQASFNKGQTVSEFDTLLFKLPTNKVGKVDSKQYGWFVLVPTAAASKAKTTPVSKAGKQIKATILQTKKQAAISAWTTKTQKSYCKGKIAYQAGYQPSPDPCAATGTTTT